ncbi:hypothetical protein SAMN05720761_11065 [Fibrobacter sp. UWCM]|uniref:hypothetical protein n=1 Tax=Fibrobacter sp. UWCM TaxID=1896208 RepID=UPI000916F9BE|nr:hypothetical protein [Fibrobacter sp. UWCM]SHH19529.1 hypothetical protein SAMN05720761_11065 [Fibrobacter sp. UWCM]
MERKRGFVLGFVLTLILSLTILFGCLLRVPGSVLRYTNCYAREVQAVYDAESAIIANLSGLPDGFFAGLPPVYAESDGPWGRICAPLLVGGHLVPAKIPHSMPANTLRPASANTAPSLCAYYGTRYSRLRFDDWYTAMIQYRAALRESITTARGFRVMSGNRRIFRLDTAIALHVADGDLTLDFDTRVPSAAFLVEGSVNVKGRARFDTLCIYSEGDVTLGGEVSVAHLEVYSGASLEVHSSFRFSGMLYARDCIAIRDRVRADFPSVAVSLGSGSGRIAFLNRASFAGVLAAPGGTVELDVSDSLAGAAFPGTVRDSAQALLPAFFDGEKVVFRRSAQ